MSSEASADLEKRADLFKALGHPVRLLIINLIQTKPRHGEELALILSLNPATVSHHLTLLTNAGLLTGQKDQYYQTFTIVSSVLKKTLAEIAFLPQAELPDSVEDDAYRQKVLTTFMRFGRVTKIPAQLKKRQVIFEKIAETFEPDRDYTEREVNIILLDFNDDIATLRRGLVETGLLTREQGIYRKK